MTTLPFPLMHVAEIEASDLLGAGAHAALANWRWCDDRAPFAHREACEFLIWVGQDADTWPLFLRELQHYGCNDDFIATLTTVHNAGLRYALLHA